MKIGIASSLWSRMRGLLGRRRCTGALLLVPCNDIHTFGMQDDIDVAFIDCDGVVIEAHRGVGRGQRLRCKRACATLERYSCSGWWYRCGDHVELARTVEREESL